MSNLINLGLSNIPFGDLADNSQSIHDGFVTQAAVYTAPVPTMPDFQDHIDALEDAITEWGPEGARGSRAQHDTLKSAAKVVKADLKQLASYAMATVPNNPDSWRLLNFNIKRPKTKGERLQKVRDFNRFISRDIPEGVIKLKWKRPLDSDPGDVKGYILQYSDKPEQPDIDGTRGVINVQAVITDTAIIVQPKYVGANYFWVTPFNSVGYGVSSEAVLYNAPGKV